MKLSILLTLTAVVAVQLLVRLPSIAGTTGTLSVKVVDAANNAVTGARVSTTSVSQTAVGLTDARGFFGFVNLSPDTYTVVASKQGYNSTSLSGVTVVADQNISLDIVLQASVKLLGKVVTSSTANVVNKSITGDLYSVNAQA